MVLTCAKAEIYELTVCIVVLNLEWTEPNDEIIQTTFILKFQVDLLLILFYELSC